MVLFQIIILLILFFLPGYLILSQFKRLSDEERFSLSLGISILMYAGVAVIFHLFKIPFIWTLIFFFIPLITLIYQKPTFNISWRLLVIFGITLFIGVILQCMAKFPQSGDTYWHYLLAKSFLSQEQWTMLPFTDSYWQGIEKAFYAQYRPPLFNLVIGIAFSLFGISYTMGKLMVVLFVSALILPTYLIAKKLYDEKVAIYSSLFFITINPFFVTSTFEIFVYPAVVYFTLNLFYLYLKREGYWIYLSIFAGLAYLTHTSSVILFISLIIYELIKNRIKIKMNYIYAILIFILIISPWLIRNYQIFGDPFYSSGKYAPFLPDPVESICTLSPPTINHYLSFISDPANLVKTKLGSVYLTFFPRPYSVTFSTWDINALWNPEYLKWNLSGFLSYLLLVVILYCLVKHATKLIPLLFYIGMGTCLILIGFRNGYMGNLLTHSLLLGIFGIDTVKKYRFFIYLIGLFLLLQSGVICWNRYHSEINPAEKELYGWVRNNISLNASIMSTNPHGIAYFTSHRGFTTPSEEISVILNSFKKWNVDYLVVAPEDFRLRKIDIKEIGKWGILEKEIMGYKIYRQKN